MKKSKKFLTLAGVVLAAVAITSAISTPLILSKFKDGWSYLIKSLNPLNKIYEEKKEYQQKQLTDYTNLLDFQDQADINIYFSSNGVQTYYNLLRMAMLSKKEVHFAIWNKSYSFQRKTNKNYLENFLKHLRTVDSTNEEQIREKSSVLEYSNELYWDVLERVQKIIIDNPDKKINLWINADHLKNNPGLPLLSSYSNVLINGLEDSKILPNYIFDNFENQSVDKETYFNKQNNVFENNLTEINRNTQYLIPTFYAGFNIFFSDSSAVSKYTSHGFKNIYNFFDPKNSNLTHKEIKDYIFSARDINKKRYMTHWSSITGLNWQEQRDIVNSFAKQNGKKSLLVVGSDFESDLNYITYLADTYADQYNIFYKGHPGSNYNSEWVLENFITKSTQLKYTNPFDNTQHIYIPKKDHIVYPLESQIPSEELTTDNVFAENPLRFDKFIATDYTSTALLGILNGFNNLEDILEIQETPKEKSEIWKLNTPEWEAKISQWLSQRVVGTYLKTQLKEDSKNKDLDQLTVDDFDFDLPDNSKPFLKDLSNIVIVSKSLSNTNKHVIEFRAKVKVNSFVFLDKEYEIVFEYVQN